MLLSRMGIALWAGMGILVFVAARFVPWLRRRAWLGELLAAVAVALTAGLTATALDFGGWKELDGRAALFAFTSALAATGWFRLLRWKEPVPGQPATRKTSP